MLNMFLAWTRSSSFGYAFDVTPPSPVLHTREKGFWKRKHKPKNHGGLGRQIGQVRMKVSCAASKRESSGGRGGTTWLWRVGSFRRNFTEKKHACREVTSMLTMAGPLWLWVTVRLQVAHY